MAATTTSEIARRRLHNQGLAAGSFGTPAEAVRRLGAVQAQDYLASLWALGIRARAPSEEAVEGALADGSIVRTWPMRGTLHFVAAADARWMLELLTPRVLASNAGRYRQLELDERVFARAEKIVVRALRDGGRMTRPALYRILEEARIATAGSRGLHILSHLAQRRVICFGAREGKQQTFVLFDSAVPAARPLARAEALAELALRYFTSHGPATVRDFAWWSGLKMADARAGLESVALAELVADGSTYRTGAQRPARLEPAPAARLLPAYDEYLVGYSDRSAVLDPADAKRINAGGGLLNPAVLVDGLIGGVWRRTLRTRVVAVQIRLFSRPAREAVRAIEAAAEDYARFVGRDLELSVDAG